MSQSTEDKDSAFKLAKLLRAFDRKLDSKFIEKILQTKGDVNYRVPENIFAGATALHLLIYKQKSLEIFLQLLRHGADVTMKNREGKTVLREFLEGSDFSYYSYKDSWGLNDKLSNERVDAILATHLAASISENPRDKHGLSHFHIACMADHPVAVEMFLNSGVPVDLAINEHSPLFPGCTPLDVAVRSCALEVVKVLLKHFDDPIAKIKAATTAMHWLIECNMRIVDSVISQIRSVCPEKLLSKLKINQQMIHLLYDSKMYSSKSEIGLSNLHIACTVGEVSMLEDLLKQVVHIDQQVNADSHLCPGYTALHFAAYADLEIVHFLLARGANILIESTDGSTPFDICVERYGAEHIHSIMSTQLIWKGITLLDGRTQLIDLVSSMQDIGQFQSFLDHHIGNINMSVNENSPLWPGYTPLHLAVLFTEQTKNRYNYTSCTTEVTRELTITKGKFVPNLELVEECLSRGADVTAKDLFGSTPLHLASHQQKTDTITKLLQFHHSSLNPIDKNGVSHLHIACASVSTDIVEKLLQSGANVNLPVLSSIKIRRIRCDSYQPDVHFVPVGSTPLHIAVAAGKREMVKLLVDSGADVNAVDVNGVTPIHRLLVDNSSKNIARIVLSGNLQEVVSDAGISHLHVASYFGDVEAVKRLLNLGADIEAPLARRSAVEDLYKRYERQSTMSRLIYAEGSTAWHTAVWRQSEEVAKLLTSRVPDFLTMPDVWETRLDRVINSEWLSENDALAKFMKEVYGLTALHLACHEVSLTTVRKLIHDKMDVNIQVRGEAKDWEWLGYTPLHMLIADCILQDDVPDNQFTEDALAIIQMLLSAGADVTLCDGEGSTPIHLLTMHSCFLYGERFFVDAFNMMFNSIQSFHVNPVSTSSSSRMSHFHIACLQNNTPIIQKFLEHGVDVNAAVDLFSVLYEGNSALHLIVDEFNDDQLPPKIEAINALLEYGADVNAQNIDGDTILHKIARFASDRVDILERLISGGADLEKLNVVYETPFAALLLSKKATPEGIQKFIEHGCSVNDFNIVDQQGCLSRPLCAEYSRMEDRDKIFEALFKSPRVTELDAAGRTAIHNIVSAPASESCKIAFGFVEENVSVEEYSSLIARLCKKGCDINARDQLGRTALHLAVRFKNDMAVAALLMNGADVNVADSYLTTAFQDSINYCECRQSQNTHRHDNMIQTFLIHVRKLEHLQLKVNETNMITMGAFKVDLNDVRMLNFYQEVLRLKPELFEKDSVSFKFEDLLSETGIVAVYPFKESVRLLLDNFFKIIDDYLADYREVIGLVKLQIRKAIQRTELIEPATESLNEVVGFPFPEICRQRIVRFLSNSDLENLIG